MISIMDQMTSMRGKKGLMVVHNRRVPATHRATVDKEGL